jgi:hypothetical protein
MYIFTIFSKHSVAFVQLFDESTMGFVSIIFGVLMLKANNSVLFLIEIPVVSASLHVTLYHALA